MCDSIVDVVVTQNESKAFENNYSAENGWKRWRVFDGEMVFFLSFLNNFNLLEFFAQILDFSNEVHLKLLDFDGNKMLLTIKNRPKFLQCDVLL